MSNSQSHLSRHPFQADQNAFSAHIRDPENEPGPNGIEVRRLAIYQRLFYDNVESFCSKTFRAFREVVEETYWHSLIREFIRSHECKTPYFREIPNEFLQFLVSRNAQEEKYPYIVELCHFDFVRVELYFAPDSELEESGELIDQEQFVVASPNVRLLSYQWPVHRIGSRYSATTPPEQPTWLIGFRNRADKIEFLVSNPRTIRMIELLREARRVSQLVELLATELHIKEELLREQTLSALKAFARAGVVYVPAGSSAADSR